MTTVVPWVVSEVDEKSNESSLMLIILVTSVTLRVLETSTTFITLTTLATSVVLLISATSIISLTSSTLVIPKISCASRSSIYAKDVRLIKVTRHIKNMGCFIVISNINLS
jgi:hypothetical protein